MSAQDHASDWTRHHSGDDVTDDGAEPDTLEDIRVALELLAARAAHVDDWPKELGRIRDRVSGMEDPLVALNKKIDGLMDNVADLLAAGR